MRFLLFTAISLASYAFAQDAPKPKPPITITAEQVQVPWLKLENAQLKFVAAQKAAEEARKEAEAAQVTYNNLVLELLAKQGIKREDLARYDIQSTADGGLTLQPKPEVAPKK